MAKSSSRIRIDDDGQLEIVDPGFDSLELLQAVDADFQIRQSPLASFTSPRFLKLQNAGCGILSEQLNGLTEDQLWTAHAAVVETCRGGVQRLRVTSEASVFDLKIELCWRVLSKCRFCAHRCEVNRTSGERGICQLGVQAIVAEHFVHIAEESPINPSLVLNLAGCSLRCLFCQQASLLFPSSVLGEQLDTELWERLDIEGARSLSFVGGNPDESLYAILHFLASAPQSWELPVVWNSHGYASPETLALLEGVIDAYVPDLKYGDEQCGQRLSAIPHYPATAKAAIVAMLAQGVPVIVRILVLPGHFDCCHRHSLDFLADLPQRSLFVSVRGQYCPDWRITQKDGPLARRVTPDEIGAVRDRAIALHLNLMD